MIAVLGLAACDPTAWVPVPPPPVVEPAVEVSVRVVEYPVEGTTEAEWRASLDRTARLLFPERPAGQPYGLTSPDLDVRYEPRPHPTGCAVASVRVRLEVVEFVPEQAPVGFLATSEAYRDFARHVLSHEDGHKDIDVRWAHALADAIAAVPVQPDCEALAREVERVQGEERADRDAEQAAYHDGDLHRHRR